MYSLMQSINWHSLTLDFVTEPKVYLNILIKLEESHVKVLEFKYLLLSEFLLDFHIVL